MRDARSDLVPLHTQASSAERINARADWWTYEAKEHEPRPEDKRAEERRHGLRGDALLGAERVGDLWARREGDLVGVRRRWVRGGHIEVEELILSRRVHEGAKNE